MGKDSLLKPTKAFELKALRNEAKIKKLEAELRRKRFEQTKTATAGRILTSVARARKNQLAYAREIKRNPLKYRNKDQGQLSTLTKEELMELVRAAGNRGNRPVRNNPSSIHNYPHQPREYTINDEINDASNAVP